MNPTNEQQRNLSINDLQQALKQKYIHRGHYKISPERIRLFWELVCREIRNIQHPLSS